MRSAVINKNDGILAGDFEKLFKNLGYICNPGMVPTDEAMLEIMREKEKKHALIKMRRTGISFKGS